MSKGASTTASVQQLVQGLHLTDSHGQPSKGEFEDAVEKLSWLTELEKYDLSAVYVQIEDLCDRLGLRGLVPKIKFVGMESVGKSSLIEAFLKLPVSFTAEGRATFAPILYRVRKNAMLGDDIKATIQYDPTATPKTIAPDQLGVAIRDHMIHVREKQGVSTVPLVVTIESGHPSTRNITIVDTPGKIRTDIEGNSDRSKSNMENIALIVDTVLGEGGEDVIVLVENGAASPGSVDTFRTTVQTHDPNLDRTIPVCTHLDSKFANDFGSTKSAQDHFNSWKHVFERTLPYWVALHNLSSEKRKELGFEGSRQEILQQLAQNEKDTQKWLSDFNPAIPSELTAKMGISATVDAIQDVLSYQFLKKSTGILQVFDEFKRLYESELELYSVSNSVEPATMMENPISGIITDFTNKFVRFYVSSFRGIMPGGYGNKKVQDIFRNGFTLADEHRVTAVKGDVDPWPRQGLSDDEYAKYVTNAKERLASGAQRLDRLKCELGVRIMSVEPQELSDESILNLIGRDFGKDILDLNQAVTQLVRLTGNQLFVATGCKYIGSRAQLILVTHADLVLAMLTSEYPALLSNQVFVSEFKNAVYEVFNGLADEFADNIKKQVISTTSSIRMGRPTETEQAFRFLYGFDEQNTLSIVPSWRETKKSKKERERERKEKKEDKKAVASPTPPAQKKKPEKPKDSDEDSDDSDSSDSESESELFDPTQFRRMTRDERMRAITKLKVSRDDQIENPRTGKIKPRQYDQARYVFRRQFSLLRLQYWLVVESALHGDVQEKILGPPGIQNLDTLLLQRLLLHETKKTRLSEPELNERYHWREQLELHKQSMTAIHNRLEIIRVVSRKLRVLFELLNAKTSIKQISASLANIAPPALISPTPVPVSVTVSSAPSTPSSSGSLTPASSGSFNISNGGGGATPPPSVTPAAGSSTLLPDPSINQLPTSPREGVLPNTNNPLVNPLGLGPVSARLAAAGIPHVATSVSPPPAAQHAVEVEGKHKKTSQSLVGVYASQEIGTEG